AKERTWKCSCIRTLFCLASSLWPCFFWVNKKLSWTDKYLLHLQGYLFSGL
ncbi:hypothetical protein FQA47_013730, partial [Oryzias melastigma]